jgi:hypothetical protein
MLNRIRVIMTLEGMKHLGKPLTFGYMISCNAKCVYVLEDDKKTIVKYSRNFWKPYHPEETY